MVAANIVHYDLKCDNILLRPAGGVSETDFWQPLGPTPPFNVVLADFGESKQYIHPERAYTSRNRGTEYIKSPEMLTVSNASVKTRSNYDRRKCQPLTPPSRPARTTTAASARYPYPYVLGLGVRVRVSRLTRRGWRIVAGRGGVVGRVERGVHAVRARGGRLPLLRPRLDPLLRARDAARAGAAPSRACGRAEGRAECGARLPRVHASQRPAQAAHHGGGRAPLPTAQHRRTGATSTQ
eukprot:1623225-Pyramimonas_sp.AAC.1